VVKLLETLYKGDARNGQAWSSYVVDTVWC